MYVYIYIYICIYIYIYEYFLGWVSRVGAMNVARQPAWHGDIIGIHPDNTGYKQQDTTSSIWGCYWCEQMISILSNVLDYWDDSSNFGCVKKCEEIRTCYDLGKSYFLMSKYFLMPRLAMTSRHIKPNRISFQKKEHMLKNMWQSNFEYQSPGDIFQLWFTVIVSANDWWIWSPYFCWYNSDILLILGDQMHCLNFRTYFWSPWIHGPGGFAKIWWETMEGTFSTKRG